MRLVRYCELQAKGVPWSMTHLTRLEACGAFPRRIRFGTRTVRWSEQAVDQWMAEHFGNSDAETVPLSERSV